MFFKKVSSLPGTVVWQSTSFLMFVYTSCGHHVMSVWDAFLHKLWCFCLVVVDGLGIAWRKKGVARGLQVFKMERLSPMGYIVDG